jgi:cell wall-associated NlpC family hydrolase
MIRRLAGIAILFLALSPVARAGTLGLAEVRASDGTLVSEAGNGAFAYPADGSVLRIGSATATAARVELRDVTMFSGRVYVSRIVVPARGLAGARVDGLVADGKAYVVGPNALIHLQGGSYIVALQEAVSPGRHGSGLVGLRVYVADPSLGLAPGTQLLVGMARAAHPTGVVTRATAILGLPQIAAAQASMAGVPSTLAPLSTLLPTIPIAGSGIGAQAVALAEHFLGVPYVWGGADPLTGFDCSGLALYVYGQLGVHLTHYTGAQFEEGIRLPREELQPGDLVFFDDDPVLGPQHEGIYVGDGRFVQAPHTGDVVKVSSLDDPRYGFSYVGAVRPSA